MIAKISALVNKRLTDLGLEDKSINQIIKNSPAEISELIKFHDLERKTLSIIVKDKYIREVMFVNKKINKLLIKNKYAFECRDSYFNSNVKCFN